MKHTHNDSSRKLNSPHFVDGKLLEELNDLRFKSRLLDYIDDAIIVTNVLGNIVHWNPAAERLFGWEEFEVIGKSIHEVTPTDQTVTESQAIMSQLRQGRKWTGDFDVLHRNGKAFKVRVRNSPVFNEFGELEAIVGVSHDITDQRKADAELKRAYEMLEQAQDIARMGNWSLDVPTGTVEISKQMQLLTNCSSGSCPSSYSELLQLFQTEDSKLLDSCVQSTLTYGTPYSIVLRTKCVTENSKVFRAEGQSRMDSANNIVEVLNTLIDISDEVALQRELRSARLIAEQADEAKGKFLTRMSHEMRTPLTAILGFAEMLDEEIVGNNHAPILQDHVQTILHAGKHLLQIINNLLDLSRVESGTLDFPESETNLPDLIQSVYKLLKPLASAKGIELKLDVPDAMPVLIVCSSLHWRQILINVVGNAIKFTSQGSVLIRVREAPSAENTIVFEIVDTGIGLLPEQSKNIFEDFCQGDAMIHARYGGTGLGLSISRKLATKMNGTVFLKSTEYGKGSTFCIQLPFGKCLASLDGKLVSLQSSSSSGFQGSLSGKRILVAEDGLDNQQIIRHFLEKAGVSLDVVEDGFEAIQQYDLHALDEHAYDLLLTDIDMPRMDGYALAKSLRCRGINIPIVAITAHALAHDKQKCLEAGCDAVVQKQIDRGTLLKTIFDCLAAKSA